MTSDGLKSDEPTPDPLAFAFATVIVVGATFLGSFVMNEVLRRKECRECER